MTVLLNSLQNHLVLSPARLNISIINRTNYKMPQIHTSSQIALENIPPERQQQATSQQPTTNKPKEASDGIHAAHERLPEGHIRLVRIQQNASTGGIECSAEQFPLSEPPNYIAVSYACGGRPPNCKIDLNGREWYIRKNLWRFVCQCIRIDVVSSNWLWIDAICINQNNDSERAHQVRLMADIYQKASRVLVWLGPAYQDSDTAMKGLAKAKCDEARLVSVPWLLALDGICSRKYWRRLWVLQELKLAKEKDILCGEKLVSWRCFEAFMFLVNRTAHSTLIFPGYTRERLDIISNSDAMSMVKLVLEPLETTLWDILHKTGHLHCEEVRDKAYALLGLQPDESAGIEPDYTTSPSVFLNEILRCKLNHDPAVSLAEVNSRCCTLETMFNEKSGKMFAVDDPTNELSGLHPLYREIYARQIKNCRISLHWAVQYRHPGLQELIKWRLSKYCASISIIAAFLAAGAFAATVNIVLRQDPKVPLTKVPLTLFLFILALVSSFIMGFLLLLICSFQCLSPKKRQIGSEKHPPRLRSKLTWRVFLLEQALIYFVLSPFRLFGSFVFRARRELREHT